MGYIAAAVSKGGDDASELALRMLGAAGGPEGISYGFASGGQSENHRRLPEFTSAPSPSILAFKGVDPHDYPPQPLTQRGSSLCLTGSLYGAEGPDTLHAANMLIDGVKSGVHRLLSGDGCFAVAALDDGVLTLARDRVGVKPLYIGESDTAYAAASNRKMLMSIGAKPRPVLPGHIVRVTGSGISDYEAAGWDTERLTEPMDRVVEALDAALRQVSADIAAKAPTGALAFSGGIDSTLVAHYLREAGVRLSLICVGVDSRDEYGHAQEAADCLGLPLRTRPFAIDELEAALPGIVASVEEDSPLSVGVAAPLYFAAATAKETGHTTLFSGGGSDELFGGYLKYQAAYAENPRAAEEMMNRDALDSWRTNHERDSKVAADAGLELRLPFAHPRIVSLGLSMPAEQKLPPQPGMPRKVALRRLAETLGFPQTVWARPKKAAQYSTGVQKALNRIAKRRGVSLRAYLNQVYRSVFEEMRHD